MGFILASAGLCLLGSAYGFLQSALPFGLLETNLGDRSSAGMVAGKKCKVVNYRLPAAFAKGALSLTIALRS
jgi:hypothetical protein